MPDTQPTEAEQLVLWEAGAELLTLDQDEHAKRYTAEQVSKNREKYRSICRALAEGIGKLRISRAYGVSIHTVLAIANREPALVAAEKRLLSRLYSHILSLSGERYYEALVLNTIPAAQLPIGHGIFSDKKARLDGEPTSLTAHVSATVRPERMAEIWGQLRLAAGDANTCGKDQSLQSSSYVVDVEAVTCIPRVSDTELDTVTVVPTNTQDSETTTVSSSASPLVTSAEYPESASTRGGGVEHPRGGIATDPSACGKFQAK